MADRLQDVFVTACIAAAAAAAAAVVAGVAAAEGGNGPSISRGGRHQRGPLVWQTCVGTWYVWLMG